MIVLVPAAVIFIGVMVWLCVPLHDPNDESLPLSMRGGPK